jgi:ATP-dependent protease ClpP protease subunit
VEGICASAATYIAVAADYRLISPHATMMIHQYSGSVTGKFEDIEFQAYTGQKTMDTLYNIYSTYSNLPDYRIREILKNDLFLTPDDCLKYGMVDIVLQETPKLVYENYFKRNKEYSIFKNIISNKMLFNNIYLYGDESPADFYAVAIETVKQIQEVLKGKVEDKDISYILNNIDYPDKKNEKSLEKSLEKSNLNILDTKINSNNKSNNNNTEIKRTLPTGDPRPIVLYISDSSMFNTLEDILPIINTILISRIPIFSVINGPSTETTAIYSILCTKRYIQKYGSITIDLAWLWREVPKYSDIIKNTEVYRKIVLDIFTKHTNLPKEILDTLFTSKHYFDARKCLEYKLCDAII